MRFTCIAYFLTIYFNKSKDFIRFKGLKKEEHGFTQRVSLKLQHKYI